MKIIFTRHAKRRMQLYSLSEQLVTEIIDDSMINKGKNFIIKQVEMNKYPIKIVYENIEDEIVIITAYPLKKGMEK